MGFSCHSALQSLKDFITFPNLMRPTHSTHAASHDVVEDDEFDPCPSLVILPVHIINKDRLPIVQYATLKPRSHAHEEEEEEREKEDDEEEESGDECCCTVCLSEIEAGHNVRVLGNCEHAFHVDCLDSWMSHGHTTCPLCRAELVSCDGKDPWRWERMVYLFGEDCLMEHLA